jgi:hypothetical protein
MGDSFILDDVYDPVGLAVRLGADDEREVFDPFKLAARVASRVPVPADPGDPSIDPVTGEPLTVETLTVDPGTRHSPGEGRFYVLREERLHLTTEVARRVV